MHEVVAGCGFRGAAVGRANGGSRRQIAEAPVSIPPRVAEYLGDSAKIEFRSRPSSGCGRSLPWHTTASGLLLPLAQSDYDCTILCNIGTCNKLPMRISLRRDSTGWRLGFFGTCSLQISRPSPRPMSSAEPAVRNSLTPKALNRNYTFRIRATNTFGSYPNARQESPGSHTPPFARLHLPQRLQVKS